MSEIYFSSENYISAQVLPIMLKFFLDDYLITAQATTLSDVYHQAANAAQDIADIYSSVRASRLKPLDMAK